MAFDDVAELYLGFATETAGESACLHAWAASVAGDQEVLAWIARLPELAHSARKPGRRTERFVLALDGRAVARTHGHGASTTWIAER